MEHLLSGEWSFRIALVDYLLLLSVNWTFSWWSTWGSRQNKIRTWDCWCTQFWWSRLVDWWRNSMALHSLHAHTHLIYMRKHMSSKCINYSPAEMVNLICYLLPGISSAWRYTWSGWRWNCYSFSVEVIGHPGKSRRWSSFPGLDSFFCIHHKHG